MDLAAKVYQNVNPENSAEEATSNDNKDSDVEEATFEEK